MGFHIIWTKGGNSTVEYNCSLKGQGINNILVNSFRYKNLIKEVSGLIGGNVILPEL